MLNIEQILKDLYDSEIDFHLSYLWDGGYDYSFHNMLYPLAEWIPENEIIRTWERDLQKIFAYVIDDVLKMFPNSSFSKNYAPN